MYKPVDLGTILNLSGNRYIDDEDNVWLSSTLVRLVEEVELEVFELPLQGIDLTASMWESDPMTIIQVARHIDRMSKTDLNYPIILNQSGAIMDGWHRVLKALIQGEATIKAVRFTEDPIPDYKKPE